MFTEANKVLDAFVKDLRKSGKIAGVVHKKAVSKDETQRLFESGGRQSKSSPTAENGMVLSHPFLRTTRKRKSAAVEPWNALLKNNATRCRVF